MTTVNAQLGWTRFTKSHHLHRQITSSVLNHTQRIGAYNHKERLPRDCYAQTERGSCIMAGCLSCSFGKPSAASMACFKPVPFCRKSVSSKNSTFRHEPFWRDVMGLLFNMGILMHDRQRRVLTTPLYPDKHLDVILNLA